MSMLRETYDLAPHAIAGGILVAATCAAFGALLRWRRLVWAGFAIPEAATAGAAFALGQETLLPALGLGALPPGEGVPVLIATALAIAWLVPVGRAARPGGERAAAICFLAASTLAVLFVCQSPHGTEEVRSLVTGKALLFLSSEDVTLLAWTLPPLLLLVVAFTGPFSAAAFDRDHARVAGHPVVPLEAGFAVSLLALVSLSAPRAGAPFVFAYLTLPPAAAERLAARPFPTMLLSVLLGVGGFLAGATASVRFDIPFATGAAAGALIVAAAAWLVSWARDRLGKIIAITS
ncbi:MAG TPA: metal ABC transporter permease [Planctomycetota bacterium]|nr:metal ABC transporter permease [Planctomycetota bacterium]